MLSFNDLIPGAAGACIVAFVMRWLIQRNANAYAQKLGLIFSRPRFDTPGRTEIAEAVRALNEQNANYMLAVKDACNIQLRGKEVTLVYGKVGSMSTTGAAPAFSTTMTVYALAWEGQVEWFENNSDIFQKGAGANHVTAFWVKLDPLVREIQ